MTERLTDSDLEQLAALIAEHLLASDRLSRQLQKSIEPMLRKAYLLAALDNDSLIPLTEAMEALGISRDVAERLRDEKRLRPVVTRTGKNTKLYATLGHIRNFVRHLENARVPSKRRSVRRRDTKRPRNRTDRST